VDTRSTIASALAELRGEQALLEGRADAARGRLWTGARERMERERLDRLEVSARSATFAFDSGARRN
jgi:hypothetical protein